MEKSQPPKEGAAAQRAGTSSASETGRGRPPSDDAASAGSEALPPSEQPTFVVGIGASAGGLEAIERFFRAMPVDSGMAFVVIQHLSPDFESLMDQLLARFTPMLVERVDAAVIPRRNTIYLLPPRKEMVLMAGQLRIYDKPAEQTLSLPINVFFRSLAREMSDRAIAIVLSGTGTDGSMGVMDVHDAGGLVIAQSEETAKFDGMPRSAVLTGHVDAILAPEAMPEALLAYAKNPAGAAPQSLADKAVADALRGVPVILQRLREVYGIDFNFYKPATTSRRIERRMTQGNFPTVQEYCDIVVRDPGELDMLYKDLLIGVTRFFRDPEAFAVIHDKVIPAILDQVPAEREIRVWIAGCATGEEAYSIGMLFLEAFDQRQREPNIKIFASDVHRESLQFAALGIYPETSLADISAERREKFFERDAKGFRVAPRLRKILIFSPHNLIKDPPFTRMDLVSCRNLLIYLQQPAQTKVLASFHFALSVGGFLLLGPSEGTGEVQGEFEVIERHWKLYRKSQDSRLPVDMRVSLAPFATRSVGRTATPGDLRLARAYDVLLTRFVPSAVLVDDRREVLHVFGDADQYLHAPSGRMVRDIVAMARGDLRIAISSAIQNAIKRGEKVVFRGVRTGDGDHHTVLDIVAEPIVDRASSSTYVLVLFEKEKAPSSAPVHASGRELTIGEEARERIQHLEVELRHAKESLQTTIEELETSNEELQASNEELLAANEELQSTNEELHSVNEELYSVNSEHEQKIKELAEVSSDLKNLMHATEIGTLFLDRDQRIRLFTPAAARLFNLLPQDEGRDIRHITSRIKDDDVFEDIATASVRRTRVESHVHAPDGSVYLRRIMPYFNVENQPDGLVITFVDVSALARAEERLRALTAQLEARVEERTRELAQLNAALQEKARDLTESEERFRLIVDHAPEAILTIDAAGKIALANAQAGRLFGYEPGELLGQEIEVLVPDATKGAHRRLRTDYFASPTARMMGGGRAIVGRRKDGSLVPVEIGVSSIRFQHEVHAMAFVSDLTARRALEEEREHILRRMTETQKLESLGVLAGGIAHDFNNLLTGISANASIAQGSVEGPAEDASIRDCLTSIQTSTRRAAELCHQLLAYSGRGKFVVQSTDLSQLVQDTAKLVHASIQRRIDVRFDLTPGLPPVSMDVTQIRQVIMNLLINGAEAIGDGSGQLTVSTGIMQVTPEVLRSAILSEGVSEGPHVYLEVSDTGSGIEDSNLQRIFEPFFTTKFTGRGLGLSATLGIVRGHRGTMMVRTTPGRGTTFRVALPPADTRATTQSTAPAPKEPSSFKGSGHVLVVDDDDLVRNIARRLLQRIGFEVTVAMDGREALDIFAQDPSRYALVLLDLTMPRVSGAEAFAEMKKLHPSVRVLLMSGFTESEVEEAFGSDGPVGFLPKPFDIHSLGAAVRIAIEGAPSH